MNELTEDIPATGPVCGKPMLWHIMKIYKHYGFDEFILLLGYKGTKSRNTLWITSGRITVSSWIQRLMT